MNKLKVYREKKDKIVYLTCYSSFKTGTGSYPEKYLNNNRKDIERRCILRMMNYDLNTKEEVFDEYFEVIDK